MEGAGAALAAAVAAAGTASCRPLTSARRQSCEGGKVQQEGWGSQSAWLESEAQGTNGPHAVTQTRE